MPKKISHDRNTAWNITGDKQTWTLEQQATITVDNVSAISVAAGNTGNKINLFGDIVAEGDDGEGFDSAAVNTKVVVGAKSVIEADHGIDGNASGFRVINNGEIDAVSYGVTTAVKGSIRNSGEISAQYAVLGSDGAKVINDKGAEIHGTDTGIFIGDGANSVITNHGTISGETNAVLLIGGSVNRVINTGRIEGDIRFAEGNDLFDTAKGKFDGVVFGGDGDDTYRIGKRDVTISESSAEGSDRVYAAKSHTLDSHIETLYLVGKQDADGTGTFDGNFLLGNKGDNTMSGGGGDDTVGGGAGDDVLMGGNDEDVFLFRRGDDKDVITDFDGDGDVIWIAGFDDIETLTDLQAHMSQHGADTWIKLGQGDRLVIENVAMDDLEPGDFKFQDFAA